MQVNGKAVRQLRGKLSLTRKKLAKRTSLLSVFWHATEEPDNEEDRELFEFAKRLRKLKKPEPEEVSASTIRDVEQKSRSRPETILSIAYGLQLESEESFLTPRTVSIPIDRVSGIWRGVEVQARGVPKEKSQFDVCLRVSLVNESVLSGSYEIRYEGSRYRFNIEGQLVVDQFLHFHYRQSNSAAIRFGSYILRLDDTGDLLIGQALGYSAFGKRITTSTVELERRHR